VGSAGDEEGLDATSRGGDAVDDGGVSGTSERDAVDSGGVGVVGVAPVEGDALGEIDTPAEVDAPSEGDARGCGVDGGDPGVDDVDRRGGGEDAVDWADDVGNSRTVAGRSTVGDVSSASWTGAGRGGGDGLCFLKGKQRSSKTTCRDVMTRRVIRSRHR
jgi:hypothetical protein